MTTRTFGIELEIIGGTTAEAAAVLVAAHINAIDAGYTHATMSCWKVVRDSSVFGGCEVVSPVLPATEASFKLIHKVCNALSAAGYRVNTTCGFHVHVGGEHTVASVASVLKAVCRLESSMDAVLAPSRRDNRFAKSNARTIGGDVAGMFAKIDRCQTMDDLRSLLNSDRYHKLNLESFWRHQTIEFRQHQGTLNAGKIIEWVKLCVGLCDTHADTMLTAAAAVLLENAAPMTTTEIVNAIRAKGLWNGNSKRPVSDLFCNIKRDHAKRITKLADGRYTISNSVEAMAYRAGLTKKSADFFAARAAELNAVPVTA